MTVPAAPRTPPSPVSRLPGWLRRARLWRRELADEWRLLTAVLRRGETPVIVYQMGKVGSSSLTAALRATGRRPVFQVHRLLPDNIRRVQREYRQLGLSPPPSRAGRRLYRDVVQAGRPARVITLVREPVTRNVSAFFQNLDRFAGAGYDPATADPAALVSLFLARYPHALPLNWFDNHLGRALGLDVYQRPFPKEPGWQRIAHGPFEILILKTELADAAKAEAVASFLDWPDFALGRRRNVAARRRYGAAHAGFRRQRQLLAPYVTRLHRARYTRHFYAAGEAGAIVARWFRS